MRQKLNLSGNSVILLVFMLLCTYLEIHITRPLYKAFSLGACTSGDPCYGMGMGITCTNGDPCYGMGMGIACTNGDPCSSVSAHLTGSHIHCPPVVYLKYSPKIA